jgi:hypothetical protein
LDPNNMIENDTLDATDKKDIIKKNTNNYQDEAV